MPPLKDGAAGAGVGRKSLLQMVIDGDQLPDTPEVRQTLVQIKYAGCAMPSSLQFMAACAKRRLERGLTGQAAWAEQAAIDDALAREHHEKNKYSYNGHQAYREKIWRGIDPYVFVPPRWFVEPTGREVA